MFKIETDNEFGTRVMDRLENELICWLVTVDEAGTPQPSPVWFLWENDSMLIYSLPNTPKLRNIDRNSRVAVHLEGDGRGGNIVVFTGTASVDSAAPAAVDHPPYVTKYDSGIQSIGMTPQSFSEAYSVPVRFQPDKVRGH